ncbi:MAG: alpha/beta fold hydrolase [Acidobacteriota bacterium]
MATPEIVNLQKTPNLDGVTSRQVAFDSAGVRLAGTLFTRSTLDRPAPGVVVTGAWTTVKEQMAGTYARELAARGFAALAFDFTGWGESGGDVRFVEDPQVKTADILSAVDFMATLDEVDGEAISGVGLCASSGYMATAAADHPKLRKLALVAAWLHDPPLAEAVYGGADAVAELVAASRGPEKVLTAASASDAASPMYQAPYYTEEHRGLIPEYDNKFNVATWEPWLTYDGQASADRLSAPTLIICSESAALPAGARAYAARLKARPDELWLDDVSQFDFYDRRDVIEQSVDAIADHLR